MKRMWEKDELRKIAAITERFASTFLETETSIETTHIKVYPFDSISLYLSIINRMHPDGRQLEEVIVHDFLVSQETCNNHLVGLLSNLCLESSIQNYLLSYISREAISWKDNIYPERGCKIKVEVKNSVEYERRDGETELMGLSTALSRIDLDSDNTAEIKKTRLFKYVSNWKAGGEEVKDCIIDKEICTREMEIECYPIEPKVFLFSVSYESTQGFSHGNLGGHVNSVTIRRPTHIKEVVHKFEDQFVEPNDSSLVIACAILMALSQLNLPDDDKAAIFEYLRGETIRWSSGNGDGIAHEIKVKYGTHNRYEIKCEDSCCRRILETSMFPESEICVICWENLSLELNCMVLPCTHRFHENCLMTWINNNPSCPCCRDDLVDQVAIVL